MERLHDILEMLYFLSGIAIATFAAIGLRQLSIARNTAKMNAKRESLRLAADQCIYYLEHVIPLQDTLNEQITAKKVTFFHNCKAHWKDGYLELDRQTSTTTDLQSLASVVPELTNVLNAMEAFSLFFISAVADEQVAFSSVGQTFCNACDKLKPALAVTNAGRDSYCNLTKLYSIWTSRLQAQQLAVQRAALDQKLQNTSTTQIKPVGT